MEQLDRDSPQHTTKNNQTSKTIKRKNWRSWGTFILDKSSREGLRVFETIKVHCKGRSDIGKLRQLVYWETGEKSVYAIRKSEERCWDETL